MWDETERAIPNFEPTGDPNELAPSIPSHLYEEWELQDTSEVEDEDPLRYADSMRPAPPVLSTENYRSAARAAHEVAHRPDLLEIFVNWFNKEWRKK